MRPQRQSKVEGTPGTLTRKLLLLLASSSINHQQIIIIMDKFAVLYQIGTFKPEVEEVFNNIADATAFCNIMRRRYLNRKYSIYQLNEEL